MIPHSGVIEDADDRRREVNDLAIEGLRKHHVAILRRTEHVRVPARSCQPLVAITTRNTGCCAGLLRDPLTGVAVGSDDAPEQERECDCHGEPDHERERKDSVPGHEWQLMHISRTDLRNARLAKGSPMLHGRPFQPHAERPALDRAHVRTASGEQPIDEVGERTEPDHLGSNHGHTQK
jgi:hypothetical protein